MLTVTKEFRFEAAHSLPHLPDGHKCKRLHGHSYRFRVEVTGEVDDRGMVLDYAEIGAAVDPIVARLDHQNLNELFTFYTTAENLVIWLAKEIPLPVSRIVLFETATTSVVYSSNANVEAPPESAGANLKGETK